MIEAAKKLRLYPRGFLGAKLPGQVIKDITQRRNDEGYVLAAIQATFKLEPSSEASRLRANPMIDNIWGSYLMQEPRTLGFEFEESVYQTALRAFGVRKIDTWLKAQALSPSFGYEHRDFLEDTIRFIATGSRNMPLSIWFDIVDHNDKSTGYQTTLGDYTVDFINGKLKLKNHPINGLDKMSLPAVIGMWLSHENGFDDLLGSLKILFGSIDHAKS